MTLWGAGDGGGQRVGRGDRGSLFTEQLAAAKAQREQELAADAFQELDDDMDGMVSLTELQTHPELDTDGDGALSEAEAQVPRLTLGWGLVGSVAPG
ncbi:hypothetical protein P7K49_033298 [Saguinus oedipus]|uniref:EF-hand domain-containing protein n=1 Tax=Saguinus oedipus TaxID=9490 RepID=A0ABQ9TRJ4_SAGOE|nr:hypothetical protein P7K49_033298 [Saguinus oedipus]